MCAIYLSQDEVGMNEIIQGHDIHAANQERFNLSERVDAKVLLFRTIYGGTAYSMAIDTSLSGSHSESWWDEALTKFFTKYQGLYAWHEKLLKRVICDNGRLVTPTGRIYQFEKHTNRDGEISYPRNKILNYPVQGLAADIMSIARVSLHKRLRNLDIPRSKLLWVNTVHDSIVLDIDITPEVWYHSSNEIVQVITSVFEDIPKNYKKLFDVEFNLPINAEISAGNDWHHMKEIILE